MADYLALPQGQGQHAAVVVIHEWWGVNDQIKRTADRWAAEGFMAVVPDLYEGKVIAIGRSDEASAALKALDFPKAVRTITQVINMLRQHPRCTGKVAVTGYCMGGALALLTATQVGGLAAVVPFYGLPPRADWDNVDAPIQAHFASHDDWATVDGATAVKEALTARGKSMDLHVYDAQHAFCNDQRPEVYNAPLCLLAWERAVGFVRSYTGVSV